MLRKLKWDYADRVECLAELFPEACMLCPKRGAAAFFAAITEDSLSAYFSSFGCALFWYQCVRNLCVFRRLAGLSFCTRDLLL